MSKLVCLGLGYCARHYVAEFGARFERIAGTSRTASVARGIAMIEWSGGEPSHELRDAVDDATHLLISAGPSDKGDPVLNVLRADIDRASQLQSIVYLSSLGVYGDHRGAWIDESASTIPAHARGGARLKAEQDWQALVTARDVSVAVLRLAGIYGPGQNAFTRLRGGRAQPVDKPGHVFNRIHVEDIAQAIDAAFARRANGIVNVCDDEPATLGDTLTVAASMLGTFVPPALSWDEAQRTLSPMALSFYATCNRVKNERMKRELGVSLRYPTYREGLRALFERGYEASDPLDR
jgi:nucleoside-diphosphate-sugar epimerase